MNTGYKISKQLQSLVTEQRISWGAFGLGHWIAELQNKRKGQNLKFCISDCALDTGLSRKSITNYLKELIENGFIIVTDKVGHNSIHVIKIADSEQDVATSDVTPVVTPVVTAVAQNSNNEGSNKGSNRGNTSNKTNKPILQLKKDFVFYSPTIEHDDYFFHRMEHELHIPEPRKLWHEFGIQCSMVEQSWMNVNDFKSHFVNWAKKNIKQPSKKTYQSSKDTISKLLNK